MRLMLEGQAAALAAERITEAELVQVRAANDTFAALPDTTPADRLLANWQFHFAIYRAARSPLLLSVIEMFWLQSGPYLMAPLRWRTQQGQGEAYFSAGVAHHRELIDSLARRDRTAASKALQADIGDAASAYRDVLALREATARRSLTT
jgi:DNA-binding GntR family transcriptional regulator